MKPKTIKYLRKRMKLIKLIEKLNATYENDDFKVTANPDYWESKLCAEKILALFGSNKPKEVLD